MAQKIAVERDHTLEQLAAGVLMVGFRGQRFTDDVRQLADRGIQNVILFSRNVGERDAILSLTDEIQTHCNGQAIVAIDHEGGRVTRLREVASPWPSPMAWAATGDVELAERASSVAAQELLSLGINLNFAPVADILGDYRNPVLSTRCYSDDPQTVAGFTSAFVRGHRRARVGSTAKHFPGHGYTPIDSHVDLPRVDRSERELSEADLVPFRAAIRAGVDCLMVSHVWYTRFDSAPTPASTSPAILQLARQTTGYGGVIVTDCMEMGAVQRLMGTGEAVVRAIHGGADLAIVSHTGDLQREALTALLDAARAGTISVERLEEANRRLSRLREHILGPRPPFPTDGPTLAKEIARRAVTLIRDEDAYLPLREEPVGVVSFESNAGSQAEERTGESRLASTLSRRIRLVEIAHECGPSATVARLQDVSTVVVGTVRASTDPRQVELVRALREAGKRVVVVALRDPFDLMPMLDAPCFLATYGDEAPQMEALADVFLGSLAPQGRLPIELPGLYPRGHGVVART